MSEVILSAEKRVETGKSIARRMRREGTIPGVLYGADVDPVAISIEKLELGRLLRKDHSIINVKVDGKDQQAVIKEIQNHPVSGDVAHIDFMRVTAGQEIAVTIPLSIIGTAAGTKVGGLLSTLMHELQISVMPRFMPDNIEIDISDLEIGDSIRVKDLNLENMTTVTDEEEMILQVTLPRKEEEPEETDELEESEEQEPEVITARADDDKESE
jgi:large subunit ribosomal protein L25